MTVVGYHDTIQSFKNILLQQGAQTNGLPGLLKALHSEGVEALYCEAFKKKHKKQIK